MCDIGCCANDESRFDEHAPGCVWDGSESGAATARTSTRLNSSLWLSWRPDRCSSSSRRTAVGSSSSYISDAGSSSISGSAPSQRRMEPVVHHVDREPALLARKNGRRQVLRGRPRRCSHLPSPPADLEARVERCANSTTVRSRYGTRTSRPCAIDSLSPNISSSSGSDDRISRIWKPPSSSRCCHLRQQRRASSSDASRVVPRQQPVAEQPVDGRPPARARTRAGSARAGRRCRASRRRASASRCAAAG